MKTLTGFEFSPTFSATFTLVTAIIGRRTEETEAMGLIAGKIIEATQHININSLGRLSELLLRVLKLTNKTPILYERPFICCNSQFKTAIDRANLARS